MPFGLMNALSVFQRLMTRVLIGLNPEDGTDFVAVYIDDILVFSHTLQDNLYLSISISGSSVSIIYI